MKLYALMLIVLFVRLLPSHPQIDDDSTTTTLPDTTTSTTNTTSTSTKAPTTTTRYDHSTPEHSIFDHVKQWFSSGIGIALLVIGLVAILFILGFSSFVVHLCLMALKRRKHTPSAHDNSGTVVPTIVVQKNQPSRLIKSTSRIPKERPTTKKTKYVAKKKTLSKDDADYDYTSDLIEKLIKGVDTVEPPPPAKDPATNPLAAHYIPPEKFVYQSPLLIAKEQKVTMEHELDDDKSAPKMGPNEHFEFDDKLNQVFDIGSEVEIVKSASMKPIARKKERRKISRKPPKPPAINEWDMPSTGHEEERRQKTPKEKSDRSEADTKLKDDEPSVPEYVSDAASRNSALL